MNILWWLIREEEEQQKAHQELKGLIAEQYKPLHSHLHHLQGWEVVESLRQAVESGDEQKMRGLLTEETPGQWCVFQHYM